MLNHPESILYFGNGLLVGIMLCLVFSLVWGSDNES